VWIAILTIFVLPVANDLAASTRLNTNKTAKPIITAARA
jgi:hypothetical protein